VLPSFEKIAGAYGLKYFKMLNNGELGEKLSTVFADNEPALIEVMLDPFEVLGPKAASRRLSDGTMVSEPLDNMAPFLPKEEVRSWSVTD
jgi:acetolactate synthase-1/2/3 large subunit